MGDNDKHRPHDRDRYRKSYEHIFRDGPPVPPVSHDSIEVRIDGKVVDPAIILGSTPQKSDEDERSFSGAGYGSIADLDAVLKESYVDALASHPIMDGPVVYPDDALSVKLKYECGSQAFDGIEMRCGMMVAPAHREKGDGMIVYIAGAPRDILAMVLAAVDSADGFGLRDALKVCIERGVGMNEVSEVLGEEWWTG